MKAFRSELLVAPQVFAREMLERPRDRLTAGESGKGEHLVAAIVDAEWLALDRLVRAEILARQDAALRPDVVRDRRAELPLIERLRTASCDRLERAREVRLAKTLGRLEAGRRPIRRAALAEVHAFRLGAAMEARGVRAEDQRAVPVHHEAIAGEADRRLEDPGPRELSETAMRHLVRGDGTGHARRERALDVVVALHGRPPVHSRADLTTRELEHLRTRRERSARRPVEARRGPIAPDQDPGDPAEPASDRRDDPERERGREGGVEGVPTGLEDLEPSLGRERIGRDHGIRSGCLGPGEAPLALRRHR